MNKLTQRLLQMLSTNCSCSVEEQILVNQSKKGLIEELNTKLIKSTVTEGVTEDFHHRGHSTDC